jgi:hypothetical protein
MDLIDFISQILWIFILEHDLSGFRHLQEKYDFRIIPQNKKFFPSHNIFFMENKIKEEPLLPFNLYEDEESKYFQAKLKVKIAANNEHATLENATLVLTTQRVMIFTENPQKKVLFFKYQNSITHGIDKQSLVCMISDLIEKDPTEEEEEEEEDPEPDFIIEQIKTIDTFDAEGWIQVVGDYQITFDYSSLGQEALQEVFKVFSECSALNPDENAPEDEQNFFDNEFITADNIDEEGNVHFNNNEELEDGEDNEEDGDDADDEDKEEGADNNKIQEEK